MKRAIFILVVSLILSIAIIIASQVVVNGAEGTGELQVTSQPAASVYLDNKLLGTTPLCRCASVNPQSVLAAKDYTLKLVPTQGDKTPFFEHISIVKGVLTVVDRTFAGPAVSQGSILQLESTGSNTNPSLIVTSFPLQANVTLDGDQIGRTPLSFSDTTESDHVLLLDKKGYKTKTLHIRTPKQYKLHVIVYLAIDPNAPIPQSGENLSNSASDSAQLKSISHTSQCGKSYNSGYADRISACTRGTEFGKCGSGASKTGR